MQNKEFQLFFEPQKQRNKVDNEGKERVIFCLNFCLWTPFTSNNYILLISHSFERFQRLQMRYLKVYKTCLKWKNKKE
jgi:hypothetical protein